MPIRSPTVFSHHLSKSDKRGWLTTNRHGLSPILYDTTGPVFVYTDQLLCHYVFICSKCSLMVGLLLLHAMAFMVLPLVG